MLPPPCECCETDSVACDVCLTGQFPTRIQVDISGLTNGSCAGCVGLNGTYILEEEISGTICARRLTGAPAFCGQAQGSYVEVSVLYNSGSGQYITDVIIEGPISGAFNQVWWRYSSATKPDCMGWNNFLVPTLFGQCNQTAATCHITTL